MYRLPLSSLLLFLLVDRTPADSLQEGMRDLHSRFSLSLYQSLSSGLNQTNLIVSPLSVALSLGLLQLGARGNTLTQLEETLGYNVQDEPWPLSGSSSSGELSGSGDPQPSDSPWWPSWVQMALMNTVSFRGAWQKQFVFTHTQNLPFLLSNGTTIKVPMMHQASDVRFGQFRTGAEQRYTVLELPYLGQSLSLQLVLPSDRRSPLGPLEEQLGPRHIWSWDAGLRKTRMDIFIPRFKMQNRFNLKSVLPVMGISDAFNPTTADFSRISAEEGLYVSDAFHDVRIEVTEDGTKAAAATAMVLLKRSRAPVFKADRPFLFLLRHSKTGSILFMGRVMNPVDQSS
uniref:Serpin domain-containing protein n=1 Tax=Periophthalmus magnuspinnatus TaxID=409849 RepID=A0A3B4B4R1_9GOBI